MSHHQHCSCCCCCCCNSNVPGHDGIRSVHEPRQKWFVPCLIVNIVVAVAVAVVVGIVMFQDTTVFDPFTNQGRNGSCHVSSSTLLLLLLL